MAELGFRSINEMIGRMDRLDTNPAIEHWKACGLDFSKIFTKPRVANDVSLYNREKQDHGLDKALDNKLVKLAGAALETKTPVSIETPVYNVNRAVGAMLSGEIARRYGHSGLPEDSIHIKMKGTAGQSFGAWLAQGVMLELAGDANDYVGKGLSGGRIVIFPAAESPIVPEKNIVVGNTVLYGAICGESYFRGIAGERFAVRNSGAIAVVEGVGDHGCEYMTGGCVAVIGPTGRNFAAGMSGGIAYILDEAGDFNKRCNLSMVELEPVISEGHIDDDNLANSLVDLMADMLSNDEQRLHVMLEHHVQYTGSARARKILQNWSEYLKMFVKIVPSDYRRAVLEMHASNEAEEQFVVGGQ